MTTTGVAITKVLPPKPVFGGKGNREEKKNTVLEKLSAFFNRFVSIANGDFGDEKKSDMIPLHPVDYLDEASRDKERSIAAEEDERGA